MLQRIPTATSNDQNHHRAWPPRTEYAKNAWPRAFCATKAPMHRRTVRRLFRPRPQRRRQQRETHATCQCGTNFIAWGAHSYKVTLAHAIRLSFGPGFTCNFWICGRILARSSTCWFAPLARLVPTGASDMEIKTPSLLILHDPDLRG